MTTFIRNMFDNLAKKGRQEQEEKTPMFNAVYISDSTANVIRYLDKNNPAESEMLKAMYARAYSKH